MVRLKTMQGETGGQDTYLEVTVETGLKLCEVEGVWVERKESEEY